MRKLLGLVVLSSAACQGGGTSIPEPVVLRLTNDVSTTSVSGDLARLLGQSVPNLKVQLVDVHGPAQVIAAVESGKADLGLANGADIYFADSGRARGIAILQPVVIRFVVRGSTNPRARSRSAPLAVWLGALESSPRLTDLIFQAFDVDSGTIRRVPSNGEAAVANLRSGTIDALLCGADCPAALGSLTAQEGRQLAIDHPIDRLRHQYPFLRLVRSGPVQTIGIDTVLICRQDLDDQTAYELTRQLTEARAKATSSPFGALDEAPATPVRLHPGAARYYREWELMR